MICFVFTFERNLNEMGYQSKAGVSRSWAESVAFALNKGIRWWWEKEVYDVYIMHLGMGKGIRN